MDDTFQQELDTFIVNDLNFNFTRMSYILQIVFTNFVNIQAAAADDAESRSDCEEREKIKVYIPQLLQIRFCWLF